MGLKFERIRSILHQVGSLLYVAPNSTSRCPPARAAATPHAGGAHVTVTLQRP